MIKSITFTYVCFVEMDRPLLCPVYLVFKIQTIETGLTPINEIIKLYG